MRGTTFAVLASSLPNVIIAGYRPRACHAYAVFLSRSFCSSSSPKVPSFSSASSILKDMPMSAKLESPSAERNKEFIWKILKEKVITDETKLVLEIAAGSGVHTQYFASQLLETKKATEENDQYESKKAGIRWIPSDPEASARASQQAYIDEIPKLEEIVATPMALTLNEGGIVPDGSSDSLSSPLVQLTKSSVDVIININMIHISPWEATLGLMKFAAVILREGGMLYLYGPYRINGTCVESNLKFEEWLKAKDARYGVRDLEKVVDVAESCGLEFFEKVEMPANNLSVLFRRKPA